MKKLSVVSIHVLFWIVIIILPLFITMSGTRDIPPDVIVFYTIVTFFHPVVFYTFFLFIIPRTLYRKQVTIYTVVIFLIVTLLFLFIRSGSLYLLDHYTSLEFTKHNLLGIKQVVSDTVNTIFIIMIAILVRIAMYWYSDKRDKTELALAEHRLELELLKAQINPHFFFNTLNNIYSLVYKKSDDAPAAMMKLSEIMRYMIYDSKSELVPLEKEVEQLENYIELERLRTKDPGFIEFTTKGNFSAHVIAPMLLISFAENAFKHGKRKVANPGIRISISAEDGLIKYEVINYILPEPHNNHLGEGIGMQNTRRRLELIYPGCHKLEVKTDHEKYVVRLTLRCSS